MMKRIMIAAALAMAPAPAGAAEPAEDNGNRLLSNCSDDGYFMEGFCLGYIRALTISADLIMANGNNAVCIPDGVQAGQVRDMIVAYIRRNPSSRHEHALVLVSWALREAWPCK